MKVPENSKIFVPFMPSLLHLAVVKEAIELNSTFQIETLDEAFRRLAGDEIKIYHDIVECKRAEKKLILIPPRLRKNVMEAIHGLKYREWLWKREHRILLESNVEDCIFYWRGDGTVETVKTAQKLVLNSNIDIRKRFYLACNYCLVENIRSLWVEMEANGKTKKLQLDFYFVVRFWIKWLRDKTQISWKLAVQRYLQLDSMIYSSFFPSLLPKRRGHFLRLILHSTTDDLRCCLHALTNKEEEKVLGMCEFPEKLLCAYIQWPFRGLFHETAEKLWKYIEPRSYCHIMDCLLKIEREFFDFYSFFERFWESSPSHLRESVKDVPILREKIDSLLTEMRRKRKADFDELRNYKYKI